MPATIQYSKPSERRNPKPDHDLLTVTAPAGGQTESSSTSKLRRSNPGWIKLLHKTYVCRSTLYVQRQLCHSARSPRTLPIGACWRCVARRFFTTKTGDWTGGGARGDRRRGLPNARRNTAKIQNTYNNRCRAKRRHPPAHPPTKGKTKRKNFRLDLDQTPSRPVPSLPWLVLAGSVLVLGDLVIGAKAHQIRFRCLRGRS